MSTALQARVGISALAENEGWISLSRPSSRPAVQLMEGTVDLFGDEDDNYPTRRFVVFDGDIDVI